MTSEPAHRDLEATGSAKADGDSLVTTTAILDALRDPKNTAAWEQFLGRYRPVLLNFAPGEESRSQTAKMSPRMSCPSSAQPSDQAAMSRQGPPQGMAVRHRA